MDEESATLRESYACFQISVENRDYHQLSHSEIGGAKGISRHLSGETVPAHLQNLVSGYATNQASDIQSVTTSVYQDLCRINLCFGCYPSVRVFNNSLCTSSLPKISISPLAKKNGINITNISNMVAKTSLGSATVSEKLAAKD